MADFDAARELMTVQQVMKAIGARAPSTITRLIKARRLNATKLGAMGWLVYRDSVQAFLEAEQQRGPTVGFPRGGVRAGDKPAKAAKVSKRPATPAKPAKAAKKPARRR